MAGYRVEKRYNKAKWELDSIEPSMEKAKIKLNGKKALFIKLYDNNDDTAFGLRHTRLFSLSDTPTSFTIKTKTRLIEYKIVKNK